MKTLIKVFYWLLGIIAVLVIVSFLLPKTYKVERTVFIKSNPSVIYSLTSNFEHWHLWVPWTREVDSSAVFVMTGEPAQVGTSWKWDGKVLGNGEMIASELIPGELVAYDLAFNKGQYKSKGKIVIQNQGDSCLVSWIDEGDLGYSPMNRYMGLFMGRMMGPDFEKGLAKLKIVAEERNSWPVIEDVIIPAQTVIMVTDSAGPSAYASVMGKAYTDLYGFLKAGKLVQKGYPFATYLKWDSVTMFSVMNICIPVEKAEKGKGRVQVRTIPEQHAVKAIYFGSYAKMEPAYRALAKYMKENGKIEDGGPSEIYISSPMVEKDTAKWETHIVFPYK
jgi:effector-binding domain-containing protein